MSSSPPPPPPPLVEAGLPLENTLLGPEQSALVKTLTQIRAKTHFKSFNGDPIRANVYYIDGVPYRLQPGPFHKGMKKFLRLHNFLVGSTKRARGYDRIDYGYYQENPPERLPVFKPAYVGIVRFRGRVAKVRRVAERDDPVLPPMLVAKDQRGQWVWIISRTAVQTCPACGRHWVRNHTCNERRSSFFYHAVQKYGGDLWQHVRFSCPAQNPHSKQLFLTYDIETYTVFEKKGKRMHPFMLCFMLTGDPALVRAATDLAVADPELKRLQEGFYWLDVRPGFVARRFRAYRSRLQQHFAEDLVDRYQQLQLPDDFYNVHIVVIGHNICKFDELLLATELVERRDLFPQACRCDRFFMPRVGRLLFNDVLFHLPNPNFEKKDPTRLHRWAKGVVSHTDSRSVLVRFMVRDTLQLTSGAKLAKAAGAYALELAKGQCPYEAVNEHVSFGSFERDEDGFPVARYWEDPSVIDEQKQLWRDEHPGQPYDIVQACLEYCMQDVRVTQKLALTLHHSYDKYFREELGMDGHFNIFLRPTIPSNTHAFWKQLTFTSYVQEHERAGLLASLEPPPPPKPPKRRKKAALLPPDDAADPDAKKNKRPKRKKRTLSPDYVAEIYAPHRPMFKYIRQALRGGRCYPSILGPYRRPVYVFDICGMYASALTHPMPHGMPLDPKFTAKHVDELNDLMSRERPLSYFDPRIKPCILKVEAYPPPAEQLDTLPPICSRRGGRLVWTNEALYDEVITVLDILTLHNRGWAVTALHDDMNIVFPTWKPVAREASLAEVDHQLQEALRAPPFIEEPLGDGHAHYAPANETVFKPMRLLDAPPEALTVLHLENLDKMVENKRYATQIACFVLGWSRAFFSEWCEILHGPDRGTHLLQRDPQTLYGDTDSLFVTESGYRRMKERGAHRIKTPDTRLTFDPEHPALYWACDCDIKCKRCGGDTYSSEAIFLAPKLYGLKDAVCLDPRCGHVGTGKIRSKGHRQAELIYDTLERCWQRYEDESYGAVSAIPELHTRRTIFKTTLLNKVSRYDPFTIHNEQLTRVLRPWKDLTQYRHGDYLYPYDTEHPNPRTADEVRRVPPVGHEDPLAPLRLPRSAVQLARDDHDDQDFLDFGPDRSLSVEDCDEILELLGGDP